MSQQINLFNPIFRQQKKYLSAVTMAQALSLILIGALALSGYLAYRVTLLKSQARAASTQLSTAQTDLEKVNREFAPRQKSRTLEFDIQKKELDLQALQKISDFLQTGELGNTAGYAAYLRAFSRQIVDGVWLTDIAIQGAGTEIGLRGRTLNPELVPVYIQRLKNEQIMQGKSFARLEMQLPSSKADSSGKIDVSGKPAAASNYIEFSLQSSGLAKSDNDSRARDK